MPQDAKRRRDLTRRMIEQYLQNHSRGVADSVLSRSNQSSAAHLDEETLVAFTEGRFTQTEAAPFVAHLVACSSCRHKIVALLRLEDEMASDETAARIVTTSDAPADTLSRIRRLLDNLAARLSPFTDEQTVFAYQDETAETEQTEHADKSDPEDRPPQ